MAEQGTHKPLVPSSNLGVATSPLCLYIGIEVKGLLVLPQNVQIGKAQLVERGRTRLESRERPR